MFKDPIVEEVRAIRQQHAARFNYDLRKIAEDLRKKQEQTYQLAQKVVQQALPDGSLISSFIRISKVNLQNR